MTDRDARRRAQPAPYRSPPQARLAGGPGGDRVWLAPGGRPGRGPQRHPAAGADLPGVLLLWSFDPTIVLPLALAAAGYLWAVRTVDAAHPNTPVPRRRIVAWLAGLIVIEIALQSPIEAYDTTLFSDHMVQHVLLTIVAAPLLALGAPITLLLRFARPETRRRWILPVLHSRIAPGRSRSRS